MDQGFQIPGTLGWGGGWKPREIADEPWPLPNPLGVVPVVEIMNRPRIGMNPISEIDGVIAMQDAINAMWSYLFANADQAPWRPGSCWVPSRPVCRSSTRTAR